MNFCQYTVKYDRHFAARGRNVYKEWEKIRSFLLEINFCQYTVKHDCHFVARGTYLKMGWKK